MNPSGDPLEGTMRPRLPWVTLSLALGFLVVFAASGHVDSSLLGAPASRTLPLALLNRLLGHPSAWLLAANLLLLLWAAPVLERRYGSLLFALVFLAAGGFGGLIGELLAPAAGPATGAAGAIAGLVGAVSLSRPSGRIPVSLFGRRAGSAPTWWFVTAWLVVESLRVLAGPGSATALGVSVGAFAFGAAAGFGIRLLGLERAARNDASRRLARDPARTGPQIAEVSASPEKRPEASGERVGTLAAASPPTAHPLSATSPAAAPARLQAPPAPLAPVSEAALPEVDLENSHPELDIDVPPPLLLPRFADAKRVRAVPISLDRGVLEVETKGEQRAPVALSKVQALAAGVVVETANRPPVAVVDLLLNWNETSGEPLHLIRLRSDDFDARSLEPDCTKAIDALRSLLARLLDQTGAVPLPDADGARGLPFRRFDSFAHYEREVLDLDR